MAQKKKKKTKKRVGAYRHLEPISKSEYRRLARNKRCKVIGSDEGGSTWQCGKQIIVNDYVNDRHYRMRGKSALYVGYDTNVRTKQSR